MVVFELPRAVLQRRLGIQIVGSGPHASPPAAPQIKGMRRYRACCKCNYSRNQHSVQARRHKFRGPVLAARSPLGRANRTPTEREPSGVNGCGGEYQQLRAV